MTSSSSVAATLAPETRQQIAIEALAKSKPITHLANEFQVSRKFVRKQSQKAKVALNESFEPKTPDNQVLFYLPVTKTWLFQLILALVLICHSSLRGVVELFRDVFDIAISASTVHNRLHEAAEQASEINREQDLSQIKVDLRDEIFQVGKPVLVGVDAASTYCYMLNLAEPEMRIRGAITCWRPKSKVYLRSGLLLMPEQVSGLDISWLLEKKFPAMAMSSTSKSNAILL